MPLQGSLETFALSDVLSLLASTAKSGELRVQGVGTDGRVWLRAGELASSQSGPATDPVDVLFELLRLDGGTFVFNEGDPESPGGSQPVQPLLEEASQRLEEWLVIAAVVPSLAVRCALADELPSRSITLTSDRWKAIVAVSAGQTVGDVATRLTLGEFDGCRLVKELADDGLVVVTVEEPAPVVDEEPEVPEVPEVAEVAEVVEVRADVELEDIAAVAAEVAESMEDEAVTDDELFDADASGDVDPDAYVTDGEPVPVSVLAEVQDAGDDADPLSALSEAVTRIGELPPPEGEYEGELPEGIAAQLPEGVEVDGDEPINRGLLLKFLSSVRS